MNVHGQVRQKWELPTAVESKDDKRREAETNWRKVCRLVDVRDGYRCRVCGVATSCYISGEGHHHHIVYRSRGGLDVSSNILRLCRACHSAEHAKKLAIEGDADKALTFSLRDADGRWFVAKQETAPRVYVGAI